MLKTLWTWLGGRSDRSAFKDDELLRERRKALTDSARRQAAQLRADQEAGRSAVGPWSSSLGTSRADLPSAELLAAGSRPGVRPR